jgi:RNA polymerase sigma-B factor
MPGNSDMPAPGGRVLEDLDALALAYSSRSAHAPALERRRLRDELIVRCLPFAGVLARRYWGRGEPIEDLEQVARLGLVKTIDRYDPARGSFTAYAVVTISGEIKRHFRDRTWGVHVPRRLQDLSLEIGHATLALTGSLSRSPTVAELAEHVHSSEESVIEALTSAAGYTPASLNAPVGGDASGELGDLFGGADASLESVDDRLTVAGLLLRLPSRERRMLALRFYGNRTQSEIAAEFGMSQMHVSRLLSRALSWLREAMLSDVPPRWEGGGADTAVDAQAVHVAVSRDEGTMTVRLRGEIDRDAADRVRRRLRGAVATASADRSRVVVDLSGVSLVDAAGIGVLFDVATTATNAGLQFSLADAQPYVAHILAVSGLKDLLT